MFVPIAKTLPLWAQLISFGLGFAGSVGAAFLGISDYLKTATLEVRLTKDSFYRLRPDGEALFCRANFLARNATALIRGVDVQLAKVDGAKKLFPLSVDQFGTLVPKPDLLFQEHNFFGRSVVHFLSPGKSERLVYLCIHSTPAYKADQARAFAAFQADAETQKEVLDPPVKYRLDLQPSETQKVDALVHRHLATMMGTLQVEAGEYELALDIHYESSEAKFRRWRAKKRTEARLGLTFAPSFRAEIEKKLEEALKNRAAFLMFNADSILEWPTYTPSSFKES